MNVVKRYEEYICVIIIDISELLLIICSCRSCIKWYYINKWYTRLILFE